MKTREGILLGEIYKKDNTETFVIYKILFKVLKSRERETHFSTLLWKIKYYFFFNFFFLFIFQQLGVCVLKQYDMNRNESFPWSKASIISGYQVIWWKSCSSSTEKHQLVSDSPHDTRYELATNSEIFLNYGTIRASQVVLGIKSPPANARDRGLILVLGRSAEEGHDNPLHCSCLENPMQRGAWQLPSIGFQRLGCG